MPEDANVAISSEYFNNISMSKVTSEFHGSNLKRKPVGADHGLAVTPETALGKPQAVKTSSEQ